MFYNDECSITDTVIGTLFIGGMFYLNRLWGKQDAYKEIAEKAQRDEISELRKKLNELNESYKRNARHSS